MSSNLAAHGVGNTPPIDPRPETRLQDAGVNGHAKRVKIPQNRYWLGPDSDASKICNDTLPGDGARFYKDFMTDLEVLLDRRRNNVYKWFHQPFATPYGPSGDSRWADIVERGHTQEKPYLLPTQEAKLVSKLESFFSEAFGDMRPFGIMAGPGTAWAVGAKEIPTHAATNARSVAAWDLMPQFADDSAKLVGKKLSHNENFKAFAIASDFNKPLNGLDKILGIEPVLITMYGCTLGNDINLSHVPQNFSNTIKRKGFYFVTIDGAEDAAAVEGYQNPLYKQFQEAYWEVSKFMANDDKFDPRAIQSDPFYERQFDPNGDSYRATIHRHRVVKDTSLLGRSLKAGDKLLLGRSHKWVPEDLERPFHNAGFEMLASFQEGTIRGVLFAGADTPDEWMEPVRAAIANAKAKHLAHIWTPEHTR